MIAALALTAVVGAPPPYVHESLAGVVNVSDAVTISPRTLWWNDGTIVELEDGADASSLGGLYAVQLGHDDVFAATLAADPRTLLLRSAVGNRSGVALVRVANSQERDALARDAHHATGRCGAIERLDLSPPPLARAGLLQLAQPALHDESVALAEASALLDSAGGGRVLATVETLESLGTRFHDSRDGRDAPEEIAQLACEAVGTTPCELDIRFVDHAETDQQSLIITLPGVEDDDATVILGAHLDSISYVGDDAPGADDDASGVATLIEILRAISASGSEFSRRIELHFYAAEEIGLVGSDDIARDYRASGRDVVAMLQNDMNGYTEGGQTIHLIVNDTDSDLTASLATLTETYLGGDVAQSVLSAGTSDHRSWTRQGYVAAFATEDPDRFNGFIHSHNDTSDRLDPALSQRFARLSLAFLAHHAGLMVDVEQPVETSLEADLAIAVQHAPGEARYHLAVASGHSVTRVRVCAISAEGADCAHEPVELSAYSDNATRSFYVNHEDKPLHIESEVRLLLLGYGFDETGRTVVLQRREVVLAEPQ